jgi:hypothetical protein
MRKKRLNNIGSTMVEVLVGFSILMILIAGLTGIINLSSNMIFATKDTLAEQDDFLEQFYQADHGSLSTTGIPDSISLQETDSTGENIKAGGVKIHLDHAKASKVVDSDSGLNIYQIDYQ